MNGVWRLAGGWRTDGVWREAGLGTLRRFGGRVTIEPLVVGKSAATLRGKQNLSFSLTHKITEVKQARVSRSAADHLPLARHPPAYA